jgi:PAS domain S-box-containing protein
MSLNRPMRRAAAGTRRPDLARAHARTRARNRAWKVAVVYGLVAGLWIYTSDRALELLIHDARVLSRFETVKGLFFVVMTAAMLRLLLRPMFEKDEVGWIAEAIAETEKTFSETMIESQPGIVYFFDEKGRFLRWNRNFETVSGYSAEEVAAMHPLDFIAPEEQRLVEERVAEVFVKGESAVEACFLTRDGRAIPYYFTGRRIEFEGEPCLVGVGLDVSERRNAEATQHQLAAIVLSSSDAIISKTSDGIITSWNPAAAALLGYEEDEILGQSITALVPQERLEEERAILARIAAGGSVEQLETVRLRKDGERIDLSVTISPLVDADGRVSGASTIARDITLLKAREREKKEAERAMQELNSTLESRVEQRTAELQTALVRAEAADRLKSAFLATMSHELRTPLNSIIGFTGILQQGLAGPLNDEQTRQLGMVRGSARHLLDVINDVLDLSKIEAGQLEIRAEPFDLRESVQRVVNSVETLAAKKNLTLRRELAPDLNTMVSDRRRIEQILLNLLSNAIKFTDHGGVTVSVDLVADPSHPNVRFRISDTGIGIRLHDLDVLFRPFQQVETGLTRTHEGTGLGLAISRRLAVLLGGDITVVSEWTKGTEFSVTLPLERVS